MQDCATGDAGNALLQCKNSFKLWFIGHNVTFNLEIQELSCYSARFVYRSLKTPREYQEIIK